MPSPKSEARPTRWILLLLLGLLGPLTVAFLWCCFLRPKPPIQRPLPSFKPVRLFNGSRATRPPRVTEEHRRGGTWTPPATTMPVNPLPKARSEYNYPDAATNPLTDVTAVRMTIYMTGAQNSPKLVVLAELPSGAPTGSYITEMNVILRDAATEGQVEADARFLWYADAVPYWRWSSPASLPPPVATPGGATPATVATALFDLALFNNTMAQVPDAGFSYTSTMAGTEAYGPTSLGAAGILALGSATQWTDVTHAQATVGQAAGQLPAAPEHRIGLAYFFYGGGPPPTITAAGVTQSDAPPYWVFRSSP